MVSKNFEVDDLVWAKMKGFPPWPGKIAQPNDKVKPPNLKKPQHFVFFFGTRNFAWILDENITPHSEEMMENTKMYKKRPATLQSAIEEIQKETPSSSKKVGKSPSKEEEEELPSPKQPESPLEKSPKKIPKSPAAKYPNKKRPLAELVGNDVGPAPKRRALKKTPKKRPRLGEDFESSTSKTMEFGASPPRNVKATIARNVEFKYSAKPKPTSNTKYIPTLTPMVFDGVDSDESNSLLEIGISPCMGASKVAVIPPYKEQSATIFRLETRIIDRPTYPRPQTPPLDIEAISENLKKKNIIATTKKIGFIGLGMMGRGMVKNLLNSGHKVTVWNRNEDKCDDFVVAGAVKADTPSDLVEECDITFCCVSDQGVAKELVFGNCGVVYGLAGNSGKGFVQMTSIDPATSQEIAEAVSEKGSRYLEAPVIGSRELAEEGQLVILGAGDRDLFNDCETCFFAMSQMAFYLSCDVGTGSKMNIIMSMLTGTTIAAMAEAIALLERCKLSTENFLRILGMGPFGHPVFMAKGQAMVDNDFTSNTALKHQQKDMSLALEIGNSVEQPLTVSAMANEIFKRAKLLSYADHDVAAVILGTKV